MVATFHLHNLGHRIKYGNLEVENTRQQLLSTTRLCCNIKFIESLLFWVFLVTYNMDIYIFMYIYKDSYIHSFFVIFNCNVFSALHDRHETWNLRYEMTFCKTDGSIMEFFSRGKCVSFGHLLSCFLLSQSAPGKPTVGILFKITSPSWVILSISLDELNSVDCLSKSW